MATQFDIECEYDRIARQAAVRYVKAYVVTYVISFGISYVVGRIIRRKFL